MGIIAFIVLFLILLSHLSLPSQSLDLKELCRSLVKSQEEDDPTYGFNPNKVTQVSWRPRCRSLVKSQEEDDPTYGFNPNKVTQVSWRPRAFLYKGFLSDEECDHIISLAKSRLKKSEVADDKTGDSYLSNVRTSSGVFLKKGEDAIIRRIENRISIWTFLPKENAESIQVLRYNHGEKYEPHFDYFKDEKNLARGGHRMATVLMYLSDVIKGGETVFPNAEGVTQEKDDSYSDCAKLGLAVKPKKGDAVLFFSLHPDATTDELSLHGSCPVIEGEKWSAPCWIHVGDFNSVVDVKKVSSSEKNGLTESDQLDVGFESVDPNKHVCTIQPASTSKCGKPSNI